jgi:hypothetical protein
VLRNALLDGNGPVFLEVARMGPSGAWAVPTLTSLLSHKHPPVRALAARALGGIGAPAMSALPSLQKALRDEKPVVRKAARIALDRINLSRQNSMNPAEMTR